MQKCNKRVEIDYCLIWKVSRYIQLISGTTKGWNSIKVVAVVVVAIAGIGTKTRFLPLLRWFEFILNV